MQYCTFQLGQQLFGVDVLNVQEVVRDQAVTPVPRAPETVVGLINLRGSIVSTIDTRLCLGMPALEDRSGTVNVITRTSGGVVSLLVDAIGEVVDLDLAQQEPIPPTVSGPVREMLTGVYQLEGGLLQILDSGRVAAIAGVRGDSHR
jgi:purine-binding chemotaxis protein CheW